MLVSSGGVRFIGVVNSSLSVDRCVDSPILVIGGSSQPVRVLVSKVRVVMGLRDRWGIFFRMW